MTFEHKFSTRHPVYWVIAPVIIFLGVPIALVSGFGIIIDGVEAGSLLGLTVGLAFSVVGFHLGYRIIYPKEFKTIISKDMITCITNDDVTYQVNKEDIKKITISIGDVDVVYIKMKSNKEVRFPFTSWVNLSLFREELMMCKYPVE